MKLRIHCNLELILNFMCELSSDISFKELTIDTSVSTVRASAHLSSALNLDVVNDEMIDIKSLVFSVALGVPVTILLTHFYSEILLITLPIRNKKYINLSSCRM